MSRISRRGDSLASKNKSKKRRKKVTFALEMTGNAVRSEGMGKRAYVPTHMHGRSDPTLNPIFFLCYLFGLSQNIQQNAAVAMFVENSSAESRIPRVAAFFRGAHSSFEDRIDFFEVYLVPREADQRSSRLLHILHYANARSFRRFFMPSSFGRFQHSNSLFPSSA